MTLDLVVKGGTVVTAGTQADCDVGVAGETVVVLGRDLRGWREIDARGRYVLPGGVDVHVHLSPPVEPKPGVEVWCDDFYSGTLAALAGGVTTVGNMTFQREGETLRGALERDLAAARRDAVADYILHPVLMHPTDAALAEIPALAAEGHTSLKIFMVLDGFDGQVDAYLDAMRAAGRAGMLTLVHCEDGAVVRCACRELLAQARTATRCYPETRPVVSEAAAVERAIAFGEATGAPIYVVHLSSAEALERCRRARAAGRAVYVETRPLYLYLTRERFDEPDGAKYTGAPPLREHTDVQAIWHGLRAGEVQSVCSDHAPWTLAQKLDPALTATTTRQGVADLETLMPMLFSEGVVRGRISLARFVELTTTNVARLFGLYPTKGTIAVGSDADLVVWDPQARWTVRGASMHSRAGYSVYEGWEVQGRPVVTISRGQVVMEGGAVTAARGRGRWVRRGPTERL
ncbi:MAG: dihydropyrimidinase [Armatimonadota bacterium]|nr:dihydropyrimidinase [Armatimonadota bacterium]